MIRFNREAQGAFFLPDRWWQGRSPGLSAMVRVRNEAEFLEPALLSIADWCDEIVVAIQPSEDETAAIAERLARQLFPKMRVLYYPFMSFPNGPGHNRNPADSVHDRAYFYNWTLTQTTRSHVVKWDADMVALDGAGDLIRDHLELADIIRFGGYEIVAVDPLRLSATAPDVKTEPRLFRVTPHRFYRQGPRCEVVSFTADRADRLEPLFLHFKWLKASARQAWPANWRTIEHFRNIERRAAVGSRYRGPLPQVMRADA